MSSTDGSDFHRSKNYFGNLIDHLIDCLKFFFLSDYYVHSSLRRSLNASLSRIVVQKGEPIFPPTGLPVNSLWACDITNIEVAELSSQLLGIATE